MTAIAITKDEFRNDSDGYLGVVTVNARGEQSPVAVAPGDTVWLSEEEQILTANAPRRDADNPLSNGSLVLVTESREIKNKRPIRPDAPIETGAAPVPQGEPQVGSRPATEEVATPAATSANVRRKPAGS